MCVHVCVLSHVRLFVTPWTVACQVPLSMKFSRQKLWNGLPFPSPRDIPDPGIKLVSPTARALAGRIFITVAPEKTRYIYIYICVCVCVCVCVCEMKVLVAQSYPNFCDPMDYNPPGFSVHGDFSGRNTSRYSFPSLGDLPDPGIEPRSPALQGDSLPSEPPGKLYRYRDRYV